MWKSPLSYKKLYCVILISLSSILFANCLHEKEKAPAKTEDVKTTTNTTLPGEIRDCHDNTGNTNPNPSPSPTSIPIGELPQGISSVWAVDDGERIERSDINNELEKGNSVWDGKKINLVGVCDEIIAFQVIVEAGEQGASGIEVSIDALTGPGGATINNDFSLPNANQADLSNSVGRRLEVFREVYLNVTNPSRTLYFVDGQDLLGVGEWPDPLVPIEASLDGNPAVIGGNKIQAYWVDIYIPRGSSPGIYEGRFNISKQGTQLHYSIPIVLQVVDITMPLEFSLQTMAYIAEGSRIRERHGVSSDTPESDAIMNRYAQLLHRHRIDLVVDKWFGDQTDLLASWMNGSAFKASEGYEGPGFNQGSKTLYTQLLKDSEAQMHTEINGWHEWFSSHNIPWSRAVFYIVDEPGSDQFAQINTWADWAHSATNPIRTFITHSITPGLSGIDMWSMPADHKLYNAAGVKSQQDLSAHVGIYNGYRPATGTQLIDDDAIGPRTWSWIAFKHQLSSWYYWDIAYWRDTDGDGSQTNVWTNPLTFDHSDSDNENVGNGDGTMLYPGQDILFAANDHGIAGPVSSIRLKNWRRGVQDYELLRMAGGVKTQTVLNKLVPKVLWEVEPTQAPAYPRRGGAWEQGRREVIQLLK